MISVKKIRREEGISEVKLEYNHPAQIVSAVKRARVSIDDDEFEQDSPVFSRTLYVTKQFRL